MRALGDWRHHALCKGVDRDVFYPNGPLVKRGPGIHLVTGVTAEARVLCRACPVQPECLDHGVRRERFGIWGGASEVARALARRERGLVLDEPTLDNHPIGATA